MTRKKADYLHVVETEDLASNVREVIADAVEAQALRFTEELLTIADRAESPIEQLVLIALRSLADTQPFTQVHFCLGEALPERPSFDEAIFIYPQAPIGAYRVDIAIWDASVPFELRNPRLMIVECDGHEFHERTKEQARKDKQRDRFFVSRGHKVLRFTGSEIWADPEAIAEEIYGELAIDDNWRHRGK